MDESGKLSEINMEREPGELNGGWAVLVKLALVLVVPTIMGEVWLARNAWILEERVGHIMRDGEITQTQLQKVVDRIVELERRQKP